MQKLYKFFLFSFVLFFCLKKSVKKYNFQKLFSINSIKDQNQSNIQAKNEYHHY